MYNLSIIIVTKNRPPHVARGLKSIRNQSVQPLEIIIVDDSDLTESINENKMLAEKHGCIYLPSPHKGLFVNRNLGALQSKGTHIRTMDDDHELPEGHLEMCLQAIEAEPETIWTIGEYCTNQKIHDAPHPIPGQLHPRGFAYRNFKKDEYYGISDGATIYPRSVIEKKLINCEFYTFGLTYLEYGARLKYNHYTIRPLSNTYIIHHDSDRTGLKLPQVMQESRIFAMFCLSFKYQKSFYNKIATIFQLTQDLLRGRTKMPVIRKAYKKFKAFS